MRLLMLISCVATASSCWFGGQTSALAADKATKVKLPWNVKALNQAPKVYWTGETTDDGIRGLYYEGPSYKGKPTRVFAWYGAPKVKPGEKVPAVVLVHGGGGTAFEEWVRIWVKHGYAAIAMDLEGGANSQGKLVNEWSGPCRKGEFADINEPIAGQWMYHAVADVVLANFLLRSFPEIDARRIGLTGISWGGIITCVVVGVDSRFRFAVPVYGCGFRMHAAPPYAEPYKKAAGTPAETTLLLWDGSSYFKHTKMPMLWVTDPNDYHFPLKAFQESYQAHAGPHWVLVPVDMSHSHQAGWEPEEIYAFADTMVKRAAPLHQVTDQGRDGYIAWVKFKSRTKITKAELCYTRDPAKWPTLKKWESMPARLSTRDNKAEANVPEGTVSYYFQLTDDRNLRSSSPHWEASE